MCTRRSIVCLSAVVVMVVGNAAIAQSTADLIAIIEKGSDKALNAHDLDTVMSYWADDGVFDYVPLPMPSKGKQAIRGFFESLLAGFPDFATTEGRVLAAGNVVVVEHIATGTHLGAWLGIPPTGKPIQAPHIDVYDFEGTKVKRAASYVDAAGVMMQLGVIPPAQMPALVPSYAMPDPEPTGLSPVEAAKEAQARFNAHDLIGHTRMQDPEDDIFVAPAGLSTHREGWAAMQELYFQAFPDLQVYPTRFVDMGDGWVLCECKWGGTQNGPYFGVPATGAYTEVRGAILYRYDEQGLEKALHVYYDNMTVLAQITAPEYSPVGTWIVSAPTSDGTIIMLHTIYPQDSTGTNFGGVLYQVNSNPTLFGLLPEVEGGTDHWASQTVKTGLNTYETSLIVYGTKKGAGPLSQIVTISTGHAKWTITGPDTNQGTMTFSVYLAEQDADSDGLPDPGQEPMICLGFTYTSKRLDVMTGCVPTPMPAPGTE